MQVICAGKSDYVIRLDRGDEILESLAGFAAAEDVRLASVVGIGACDSATVGLYDIDKKQYIKTELTGPMEIVSLNGNLTRMDGAPYLHLHIAVCDGSMCVKGGHLNAARISVTGELFVHVLDGTVGRRPDSVTGINLMHMAD